MDSTKAVSRSVSMPEGLWDQIEAHAPTTPGRDRSGYIRNLVEADLRLAGVLPGSAHAEIIAAAEEIGIDVALAAIKRAGRPKKQAA